MIKKILISLYYLFWQKLRDRAMQALYLLVLEHISKSTADKNVYGFGPKHSCAAAIE